MEESDAAWRADRDERGFVLPKPAPLFFRLWGVRHVRHFWCALRVERFVSSCASVGIGIGGSNQYDLWVLYAIYRGWA